MSEWQERRIKDIGNLKLGKMLMDKPSAGYKLCPYLKSRNIGWLNLNVDVVEEMYFNDIEQKELQLKVGDLLFSEGGEVGKTCIWGGELPECYIQNSVHKLTLNKKLNPQFYMYVSYHYGHKGFYKSIVNQVSLMHLTYEKLRRVVVPVPTYEEQNCIVAYLDSKTSAIDSRISLLEQKCEAYDRLKKSIINDVITHGLNQNVKKKDSGVELIGEIPEHWKIRRIKEIAYIGSGTTPKSSEDKYYEGGIHPWLNTSDVQDCHITKAQFFITEEAMNDYKGLRYYPEQTVLLAMYGGGTIGNVAVMDISATINQACCAMIIKTKSIIPDYLFYFLNCHKQKIISFGFGATQDNLSQSLVAQLPVALPPIEEQKQIVEYITQKKANLDSAISILNAQIEKYKLLKRSLINEVITGQREVD